MYTLTSNGNSIKCPYTKDDLRRDNPQTSFPADITDAVLASFGVYTVTITPQPTVSATQAVEIALPVFNPLEDRWETAWTVRDKTAEELDSAAIELQNSIVQQTQARLDDFARTRNYDGILSACTYASSSVPKFAAEGQYCVDARDNTWATLYTILGEVQAGTRPVPTGFDDIAGDMPALEWPA
jgi:hypothetical protein